MTSPPLGRRLVSSSVAFSALALVALHGFVACGGDEASSTPPPSAGGAGGGAGAAGKAGGAAGGAAGKAGASGSAGASGNAGASGGAAGAGAGTAGAGAGGASSGVCKVDADCPATLSTQPAGCAKAKCTSGVCSFVAIDADADGHGTAFCKSNDGSQTVALGDDCNDSDKDISPEGWDGPAGEGKPNHCNDGIDQNCSGLDDDQKLTNGGTCTCTPGDVEPCSQTSAGKPVTFPVLKDGKPLAPCTLGSRTCLAGGKWGACTDLREPDTETCDAVDNDCNGVIDDNAVDKPTWVWDADGDLHGAPDCPTVQACASNAPTAPPTGCKSGDCDKVKCPLAQWRSTLLFKADDCDDLVTTNFPGNIERCDALDNDCDNVVDEGADGKVGGVCACAPGSPPTACFSGAFGLKLTAPAICREGTAACNADGTIGACTGQVLPSTELCNEVDDDCDGDVDEGFGTLDANKVPVRCNANDNPKGACGNGATVTCSPNGVTTFCKTNDPSYGTQAWHTTVSPAPASSPDWSCDGKNEYQPHVNGAPILSPLGLDGVRYFTRPAAFCTNKNIADLCKTIGFADCKQKNAAIVIDCVDDGNPGPFCGQTVKYIGCGYVDPEPGTPEECYPIGTTPGEAVLHCR